MGFITRQELSPELRQELDDVYDYIQGSINELIGAHMSDTNNPHQTTKEHVGLGNVDNVQQASKQEFNAHLADMNNPHNVTTSQIGAVPTSRMINSGSGLSGGGTLSGDLTLSVDYVTLDARYLGKTATATNADKLDGLHASSFYQLGENYLRMGNNDGIYYDDLNQPGEFYFRIDGSDYRAYHSNNIKRGTSTPSGGKDGDIYIQI